MLKKWIVLLGIMTMFSSTAFAQDWGFNDYDTYDPGFYDSTTSDLYDDNDDWFYDSYTWGEQREEDEDLFGWESDTDLFGDSFDADI